MYLYARIGSDPTYTTTPEGWQESNAQYVSNWDHAPDPEWETDIDKALGGFSTDESPHGHIWPGGQEVCVAYWRKANAIHSWFVENCQDGVDECQYSNEISVDV